VFENVNDCMGVSGKTVYQQKAVNKTRRPSVLERDEDGVVFVDSNLAVARASCDERQGCSQA
jgi:hypothetical protein